MQICGYGGMADALGSGPSGGNSMEVQVLLTAPEFHGRQPKNSRGHAQRLTAIFCFPPWAPFRLAGVFPEAAGAEKVFANFCRPGKALPPTKFCSKNF